MIESPAEILAAAGTPYQVFRHPSAIRFEDVLREMGFPAEQMVKTVAFRTGPDALLLAALPAPRRLSYGALARHAGVARSRIRPADPDDLRALGAEPGGVSPIILVPDVTVVVDRAMAEQPVTYCGTGRAGETLKVDTAALIDAVKPVIADISA
jgi:Cys-tRNA(Pro)/Cys-tRNA(Cys) deacylase